MKMSLLQTFLSLRKFGISLLCAAAFLGCGELGLVGGETPVAPPSADSGSDPTESAGAPSTPAQPESPAPNAGPSGKAPVEEEPGVDFIQIDTSRSDSTTTQIYDGNVADSLVSIQVKSLELLRASIQGCFGNASHTFLARDMFELQSFLSVGDQLDFEADGKKQFFSRVSPYSNRYVTSVNLSGGLTAVEFLSLETGEQTDQPVDVLLIEAKSLNDTTSSLRTTATADSLSDSYLRSLEVVAQVVAHNCDLTSSNCDCRTPELATKMLERCLPTVEIDAQRMAELSTEMATQCSTSAHEHRMAIASLVASYAFAVRR